MIIKSGWFFSVIQSGNGHYSVDHYSKAGWFYWRWNQRICWFRCWRNSLWTVLNPVVQYSGGDDSILWNRWYSLVLFHRSCFEYFQVVGVLKWLIITGEWSVGWCQKRPFHWYMLWKGYWFSVWWWWNQYLLFSDEWMIDMLWLWYERILLNSLYCLWVLYRLDVSVSIE